MLRLNHVRAASGLVSPGRGHAKFGTQLSLRAALSTGSAGSVEEDKKLLSTYSPWDEFFRLFTRPGFDSLLGLQDRQGRQLAD